MHPLSIGKLARAARVSIDTIRFYERTGLLPQPARRPSGFREYSELDLRQLRFIRSARVLGFSLDEIAELLALENVMNGAAAPHQIEHKLAVIDGRIRVLQQWRSSLAALVQHPAGRSPELHSILDVFQSAVADADAEEESTQAPYERSSQ